MKTGGLDNFNYAVAVSFCVPVRETTLPPRDYLSIIAFLGSVAEKPTPTRMPIVVSTTIFILGFNNKKYAK
jgi:hypothetical protein